RVPHLARDQAQVRPGLHLSPLALARRAHPGGHGEGDAHPAGRLSVAGSPPLAARRAADALLAFTGAAIPLSTTGMEAGVLGLAALSVAALAGGVRPPPAPPGRRLVPHAARPPDLRAPARGGHVRLRGGRVLPQLPHLRARDDLPARLGPRRRARGRGGGARGRAARRAGARL